MDGCVGWTVLGGPEPARDGGITSIVFISYLVCKIRIDRVLFVARTAFPTAVRRLHRLGARYFPGEDRVSRPCMAFVGAPFAGAFPVLCAQEAFPLLPSPCRSDE